MPAELASTDVSYQQFCDFRHMWRNLRLLAVALDFSLSLGRAITPQVFADSVQQVLGISLAPSTLKILFYLFGQGADGLNVHFMFQVMNRHVVTGINAAGAGAGGEARPPSAGTSLLECVAKCYKR
jgi:hypothetical protein